MLLKSKDVTVDRCTKWKPRMIITMQHISVSFLTKERHNLPKWEPRRRRKTKKTVALSIK